MSARQMTRLGRTLGTSGIFLAVVALALVPAHFTGLHLLAWFVAAAGATMIVLGGPEAPRSGGAR